MGNIADFLAPVRVGVCLENRTSYLAYMERVWSVIRALSRDFMWDDVDVDHAPVLAIYVGTMVDHEFTAREFGSPTVEAIIVGAPDHASLAAASGIVEHLELDGLLRVDHNPPQPEAPPYGLPVFGLLTYGALIRFAAGPTRTASHGYEELYLADETEEAVLDVVSGAQALPVLLRVLGRNLRRWIEEPPIDADPSSLLKYARELQHIGAVRAAGVVAGTALEKLLASWGGLTPAVVKKEQTSLGKMIRALETTGAITKQDKTILWEMTRVRVRCAHALVEDEVADMELAGQVDKFLAWLEQQTTR